MEDRWPVSNETEFEYWLVSAFESERKRLRERAGAGDPQPQRSAASDRKVTSIATGKKRDK